MPADRREGSGIARLIKQRLVVVAGRIVHALLGENCIHGRHAVVQQAVPRPFIKTPKT